MFLEDQANALASVQAREQARAERDADALAKVDDLTAPLHSVDFAFVRTMPHLNKPIGPLHPRSENGGQHCARPIHSRHFAGHQKEDMADV